LSNAARHAQAGRIAIALDVDGDESVLTIADDGVGFDPERPPGAGHHGLANMRARAPAIGGRLEIHSQPGAGTRIVLRLPPATGAET
jgi:signal transduction histidine kinase